MTSGTALATAVASVSDASAGLHACLHRLGGLDLDQLDGQHQAALLRSYNQAEAMLGALRLSLLASAERSRTAELSGAASTGAWAAKLSNCDQGNAQRQVHLAHELERRSATQLALSSGTISTEHAAVIVQADRHLPSQVSAVQREHVEAVLVEKAQLMAPTALRRVARRALAEIEPDAAIVDAHENELAADEEALARAKVRLSLHDNADGTVSGHFIVPTAQGHLLRKILQTITAPRRGRLGATQAQVGERDARTDWDRARGAAFCELIEHLPTDHLHPKTAATLVVMIDEGTLRGAFKVAQLDTGATVSAGQARRLACNARILPAVLGGASLPLDLGRSARLFSEPQRTAVGLAHETCAADGCERPFSWCELHHRMPWSHGGTTDLADAIPLCHFHHQRIHDHRYTNSRNHSGAIVFRRQT